MEVPVNIARLLVGYFSHTLSEHEKDILDDWICENDENMEVFEDCVEQSCLPVLYDPESDDLNASLHSFCMN